MTLHLNEAKGAGGPFVIQVNGAGPGAIYIQAARLNGQPVTVPELRHADIWRGGTLELDVGAQPSSWGTTQK